MAATGTALIAACAGGGLSLDARERNGEISGKTILQPPSFYTKICPKKISLGKTMRCSAELYTGNDAQADSFHVHKASEGMQWLVRATAASALALTLATSAPLEALARPSGVNRPELLPNGEFTTVIDVAGFLSDGQEKRLKKDIERLESDTGFKLRILAQNYPETPGLAIRDYWGVDDSTIVFVADPSLGGNILNFNVGSYVDLSVPRSFWSRLSGKYGNMFYWKEQGEDTAIESAVTAIDACLREPPGPTACSKVL